MLLLLGSSLLPYAFTWQIRGGGEWRFTMHAYPIFLIAAAHCVTVCAAGVRTWPASGFALSRPTVFRAIAALALAAALAAALTSLAFLRFREVLAADKKAVIAAGSRDFAFFRHDWYGAVEQDGDTTRTSRRAAGRVWVPLVPGRAYRVTAAVAPMLRVADAAMHLRVYLNGRRVAWGEVPGDRFSDYSFELEPDVVDSSFNVIEFRASLAGPRETTFRLRSLSVTMREPESDGFR